MAKMTKVELEQKLDAALRANEALRLEVVQLKATIEVHARAAANGTNVRSVAAPTPSPANLAYRAYLDEMKAQAREGGHSLVVQPFSVWRAKHYDQAAA